MITYPGQYRSLQTRLDTIAANGGGKLVLSAAVYEIDTPIILRSNCSIIGQGANATFIKYTGSNRAAFVTDTGSYNQILLQDFHIDLTANTNLVSGIDCERGLMRSTFERVRVTTNPANLHGIVVRGSYNGSANQGQFNNAFIDCFVKPGTNTLHQGYALCLLGDNISDGRVNCNRVIGGEYEGGTSAFFVNGAGNLFQNTDVELSRGFTFDGDQTYNNLIQGCWFDDANTPGHEPVIILPTCTQPPYRAFCNVGLADL